MSTEPPSPGPSRKSAVSGFAGYVFVAVAIWLAWEVCKAPLSVRAPAALAVRLAPTSPEVISRAAEAELVAGRVDNAKALSKQALAKAPFDPRSLRVRGLAEAKTGSAADADQMLTLAGNWSLRDDPTHAWLTEYRLRRGDFGSAFAHADTLARRRPDIYPATFNLFTLAAQSDPRAAPRLVDLLAANPPWRSAYFQYLLGDETRAPLLANIIIALERSPGPLTSAELQRFYERWSDEGRFAGIKVVRQRIARPSLASPLQNGNMSVDVDDQLLPFGWAIASRPGMSTEITEDDLSESNIAMRVQYDGFGSGFFVRQLIFLQPGTYALQGRRRAEGRPTDLRMDWEIACLEAGVNSRITPVPASEPDSNWHPFTSTFSVPDTGCTAQWLRLSARPGDRRTTLAAWFDDIALTKTSNGARPR